jgi:RNA polymerase sigma-70 factor (ECF subfamily)
VRYPDETVLDHARDTQLADGELARRLAAGDRGAEAELYRRLAPRVRLYGLRHLRDTAAADDLVQEVLLMTFAGLREGRLREPEKVASFVFGSCRRVVSGWRRSRERRERLLERHGQDLLPAAAAGEEPVDLARLARCLARLAERERTVVALSFYAERDADAIGAELRMSPGNVRVVRHRALARLRSCLEES